MSPCLGCNRIAIAPQTLRDGAVVCDQCDAYRRECEARHVLTMGQGERVAYLEGVEKKRGAKAAQALYDECKQQRRAGR